MKKIVLLFVCVLFFNISFSQQQFIIKVIGFGFTKVKDGYVNLNLQLAIKNVGNTKSACYDLIGVDLYTSGYSSWDITLIDAGLNALDSIRPGDYRNTYLVFKVPVNADDLSLKLKEESGGAEVYICPSFIKYSNQQKDSIFASADILCKQNKYEDAFQAINANKAIYTTLDTAFKRKTADIYLKYGEYYFDKENYFTAITMFDSSRVYFKSEEVLTRKAKAYEKIGDQKYEIKSYEEARKYYLLSLQFANSERISQRIKEIDKAEKTKIDKEEKIMSERQISAELYGPSPFIYINGSAKFGQIESTKKDVTQYGLEFGIIPKIVKFKGTSFNLTFPVSVGATYMPGCLNQNKFFNIYGIPNEYYSLDTSENVSGHMYLAFGLGMSFPTKAICPFTNFQLLLTLHYKNLIYPKESYYSSTSLDKKIGIGTGFKFDFGINIPYSKGFYLCYSYESFKTDADFIYFDQRYTFNSFTIGYGGWAR